MAMKKHIEEVYDTKEIAEENGKLLQEWFGYRWEVIEDNGKYRLVAEIQTEMMG